MNYRHIYHAGNFADVVKHAVLALVITRLKLKDTPFRVIDTHAGIGSYDLGSEQAQRTGEWIGGIGRVFGPSAAPIPEAVRPLLEPFLSAVSACNPSGIVTRYPGSPSISRHLLRAQDVLVANELHPEDAALLKVEFRGDNRVKVMALDGWIALKSLLPPKERRGVVLIDPPFEEPGELERMRRALEQAAKRFATGIYLLWYPIKDERSTARFKQEMAKGPFKKMISIELMIRQRTIADALNGTGLLIANPPFEIERQLDRLLPFLAKRLAIDGHGTSSVTWLAREQ